MEKYTGDAQAVSMECNGEHVFKIHYIDDGKNEKYFMGYCIHCGYTIELPVRLIEEAFDNDNDRRN